MSFGGVLIIIALILVILFFARRFLKRFKACAIGSLTLVDGGVKTGKTAVSIYLALREYKRTRRSVRFSNFFRKIFNKPLLEEPLLYSNIPLAIPYVPLTDDLLLRKKRFRYGSSILIDDASLVADSMLFKDKDLNERLLFFNKLIGHMTKGGHLIYNTQSLSDLHFSVKRCLSEYFYIHHISSWIPFFFIAYVIECRYSEDGSVSFTQNVDTSDLLKRVIIPKSIFKKYDRYCYSVLTDDLPVEDKVIPHAKSLKCDKIVSFRESTNFKGGSDDVK